MDVSGVEFDAPVCRKTHWTTESGGVAHWDEQSGEYVWCSEPGWHFVVPQAVNSQKPGDQKLTLLGNYERNRPKH